MDSECGDIGGNQNELYINQLAETGKLTFKNASREWRVSGLIDEAEASPRACIFPSSGKRRADRRADGRRQAGRREGGSSWSALFVDENLDGYPDLVVSTDERRSAAGLLQRQGPRIPPRTGASTRPNGRAAGWARRPAISTGTGSEEVFVSNCGGQSMSAATCRCSTRRPSDESMLALAPINYAMGKARLANAFLTPGEGRISQHRRRDHRASLALDRAGSHAARELRALGAGGLRRAQLCARAGRL